MSQRSRRSGLPPLFHRARRRRFAYLVGLGFLQAATLAATAWLGKAAFDSLFTAAGNRADTLLFAASLALAYGAITVVRYLERVTAEKLGQGYASAVRLALFNRITRLSPRSIERQGRGGHLLRFVGDLTAVRNWVANGLSRLLVSGLSLAAAIVALFWLDPGIAGAFAAVVTCAVVASVGVGGRVRAAVAETRRRRTRLAGNINEKLSTIGAVRVLGQLERERHRLKQQSRRLRAAAIGRARWVAALRGITDLSNGAATVLILLFAATSGASAGHAFAAMAVLGLCLPLVRDLGRVYEYWQSYSVARENLERFLSSSSPLLSRRGKRTLPKTDAGEVRFENVSIGETLNHLTCTIVAGERVVVRGGNGSGKSTMLALAARLIDPDSGVVKLDGVDIRRIPEEEIRRRVVLVSTDLPLMRGSLRFNLNYRNPEQEDEELLHLVDACGLGELVERHPRGLDQPIRENGSNLSFGERASVMLARALSGNPRILLLDEIDAHLDDASCRRVMAVLDGFEGTIVAVSHRAAAFDNIDRVIDLQDIAAPGGGGRSERLSEAA